MLPIFLVYGILFLLTSVYFTLNKNPWGIFTFTIGFVLVLLYFLLPDEEIKTSSPSAVKKTGSSPGSTGNGVFGSPLGVLPRFKVSETLQSPSLRRTFNYITDPQIDGSTGRLEYGGNRNMRKWGIITTLNYTHVRLNNMVFALRNPNSSDSYGYFIDRFGKKTETLPNFFTDYIELGTFS